MEKNDDRASAFRLAETGRFGANARPQRPNCPHCGSRLLVAEQARFNHAGRIDHAWTCDDCGAEFETFIELTREAVA